VAWAQALNVTVIKAKASRAGAHFLDSFVPINVDLWFIFSSKVGEYC
jgi:hypothetical protein